MDVKLCQGEMRYVPAESPFGFPSLELPESVKHLQVAHEIVHDVEERHPEIKKAALAFLMKRADEGGTVILSELTGKPEDTDLVYLDKWRERGGLDYTGRVYKDGGTEILTTGIQRLGQDAALFFEQDPEFFEFIVKTFHAW